ncbi:T9SS type A sorting domain-containing protein [Hymenobacter sp. J193]|uniref:DUF7619 domain-containing protein n=1 Tax=Hymenobacter sp. J193 TaxID=2898429 RepID=UPI002150CD1E|nr:T9SS type A sorting domain-containing protein [Hymenobacter sp. J193]MCR5887532.1 T9SS type A sorting domain-containing protein [Hymenobacter sp. J193]
MSLHVFVSYGQAPAFHLTETIGTPISSPADVIVDKYGTIYMLDIYGITKLTAEGKLIESIMPEEYRGSYSMGLDINGNSYFCSPDGVQKYDSKGKLVLEFGAKGSAAGQFKNPYSICVDSKGDIYVVDNSNNSLQKFDSSGQLLFIYNSSGVTGLQNPVDMALGQDGTIYVFDEGYNVTKISSAGSYIQTIPLKVPYRPQTDGAISVAVDNTGNLYMTSFRLGGIHKFSAEGEHIDIIGGDAYLSGRTSLCFDRAGNLYAADWDTDRLYKFDPTGKQLAKWGSLTQLGPITQDKYGNYYVYDQNKWQVSKFTKSHKLLWQIGGQEEGPQLFPGGAIDIAVDLNEQVYVLSSGQVTKLTADGKLLRSYTNLFDDIQYYAGNVGIALDNYEVMYITDYYGGVIRRINRDGNMLSAIGVQGTEAGQLWLPQDVAIDANGFVYAVDNGGLRVQRFSPNGQFIQEFGKRTTVDGSVAESSVFLEVDEAGKMYVSSTLIGGLQVYDERGRNKTSIKSLRGIGFFSLSKYNQLGSTRLITAGSDVIRFYKSDQGPQSRNIVAGQLFQDLNKNCQQDTNEPGLAGIPVVAEPGNYYGLSDEQGRYTIAVDTGSYLVRELLPTDEIGRSIKPLCVTATRATFATYGNVQELPAFANAVTLSPFLSVSIGSNRRRRCAQNITTVTYRNTGFATAANAQVTVTLPEQVVLVSASSPYTRTKQGQYIFSVGNLAPAHKSQIVIKDSVVCGNTELRGLTVCTKAQITPENTYPSSPTKPPASLQASGRLEANNQVRFVLRNTGTGATTDSLLLRLYQDTDLSLTHRYALAAGDSVVLRVPALRSVVRLEADQPEGHLWQRYTSATVEVPKLRTSNAPSEAMAAFPLEETEPVEAEDCQPIVDSFDPNDKAVLPAGLTAEHYTPTQSLLRYRIRFQNTGTDTAYFVTVTDTLSSDLDISTLRVGNASHNFRLQMTGQERPVLTFTFPRIMLPDSGRNVLGSQGFIEFSIRPKPNLAVKTLIENVADIVFDYNEPVRTNVTQNRLFDIPREIVPAVWQEYTALETEPHISSFAPARGKSGTLVTLQGMRFGATPTLNKVWFNNQLAEISSASPTALVVRVPAAATTGSIRLTTTDGGATSTSVFQVEGTATSLSVSAGMAGLLNVYPNPAHGSITVNWQQAKCQVREVRLYNALGKLLHAQLITDQKATALLLSLNAAKAGWYFIVVETDLGTVTKRVAVL